MTTQKHFARVASFAPSAKLSATFLATLLATLSIGLSPLAAHAQDDDSAPSQHPLTAEDFAPRMEEISKLLGTDEAAMALSRYLALLLVKSPSASLARELALARAAVLRRGAESFATAQRGLETLANPRALRGLRQFASLRSGLIDVAADRGLAVDNATRLALLEREAGRALGDAALEESFLAGNLKALNGIALHEGARSPRLERAADVALRGRAGQSGLLEAIVQEVEGLDREVGARLRATHRVIARPVPEPTAPARP